jgi:hypothetical protein
MGYCDLSIFLGIVLLAGSVLSMPIPQLRIVFRNIVISGSAGVVLIALGIILGALGVCH